MEFSRLRAPCSVAVVLACILVVASVARGQGEGVANQTQMGSTGGGMTDQLYFGNFEAQVQRDQAAAYSAFLKEPDPVKKVQLGTGFLQKYPKSPLVERIDAGLVDAYRAQQDWPDAYRSADRALALQPDDVDVLATVGWTIPHVYSPSDPNPDQELDKAEAYAKHAIEILSKIPKPAGMTDAQFAYAKARRTFQAHSALGLIDFRRQDYDVSARELGLATSGNPMPDQTDLYVLGVDFQNLNRPADANDAFSRCAQIPGALQEQCEQQLKSK